MHQLIQFRQLTIELNKSELKQLFSTLIEDESFNEEFIITSLFNQMHNNLYNSKKSPVQTINNTITNIINEREIPIDDSSENTSITFESLSSTIRNEIGSYLTIWEIFNFEKTNRRNFISMRYPYPALYSIGSEDDLVLEAYSTNKLFDFTPFKGVKKLVWDGDAYYKFDCHEMIFSKVENLSLREFEETSLSYIFQKNNCNYTSLKHLTFNAISFDSIEDTNAFTKLLTTNKDLKSLDLSYIDISDDYIDIKDDIFIDPSIILQQLPNLNGLGICGCHLEIYEQITYELNHQIESLHIDHDTDTEALNLQNGFPNLKEFCIHADLNVMKEAINKIMKKSKKIQQLNLNIDMVSMSEIDIKQFSDISQKLAQLSDLKLLELDFQIPNSCGGNILSSLYKCLTHHKRDMFKLIIKCDLKTYYDEQILNLTAIMKAWITQFSFVFMSRDGCRLKEETINTLKQIVNVKCYNEVNSKVKYVISSKGDIYIPCIYACNLHLEYECTPFW